MVELEEHVKENKQREAKNSHAVAEAREMAKTAKSCADASQEELEETRRRLRDAAEELPRAQERQDSGTIPEEHGSIAS